jgi:hypothetical protein
MNKQEMIAALQEKQYRLAAYAFRNRKHMSFETMQQIHAEYLQLEVLEAALKTMSYADVAIVRNFYGIPAKAASVQASTLQLSLF